jgi:hypothetical protein
LAFAIPAGVYAYFLPLTFGMISYLSSTWLMMTWFWRAPI